MILLEMRERNCILSEQQLVEGETEKPLNPKRSMCLVTKTELSLYIVLPGCQKLH